MIVESSESEDEPSPLSTPARLAQPRPSIQLHLLDLEDSSGIDDPLSASPSPIPGFADPLDVSLLSSNLLKHRRCPSDGHYTDSLAGSATDLDLAMSLGTAPLEARQLYLAVARCIAYPFTAKFQVDTAPPKPKLTEGSYEKICQVVLGYINQDKECTSRIILSPHEQRCLKNKHYQDMLQWYLSSVLSRDAVKGACCHGFFSTQELIQIFKVAVVQKLSMDEVAEGTPDTRYQEGSLSLRVMEGDPKYQLWVGTFTKVIEQSEQLSLESDQKRRGPLVVNTLNKEALYALFQEALDVKRSVHQTLSKACQLSNQEEQEDAVRKELQRRNELINKQQLPDCNNEGKVLGAFLYEEQRRAVKQLADNLEKVSLSSARYSPKHVGKKKPAFDGGAGGATQVSKNDLQFNEEKVKVTIKEATDISGLSEGKPVFVVFELIDGTDARATEVIEVSRKQVKFDERGLFSTHSPLPQVRYTVRTQVQSLIRDDKVVGKVVQTVSPSLAERAEVLEVTKGGGESGPVLARLRVSTFLEQPASIRRCGYMYTHSPTMFKQRKQRFFTLTQLTQFKFVLCYYQPRDTLPREHIVLNGWMVDYLKEDTLSPEDPTGLFWFLLSSEQGQEIKFGCHTTQERENWVKWLARATGQQVKPQEQVDEEDGAGDEKNTSACKSGAIQKLGLEEVVGMDSCLLPHNMLFTKLFRAVLNYQLQQPLFSRGFFSPGEMFIMDEYCARYCVRLIHRHMTCLWEWLQCELHGESIWPSMMLHSFGYCQMHMSGQKPAEKLEVVTPQERSQWTELCQQLELLLLDKLENFRYCFPFSCPKNDLKVTLKLFSLVTQVNFRGGTRSSPNICTPSSYTEAQPTKQLINAMERAALANYKQVYHELTAVEELKEENVADPENQVCLSANQLCSLAQLCIDFMYELHGFYQEDFTQFPQAFIAHVDAFWSFFLVDLHETLLHNPDRVTLLRMFHSLNHYFCSQPTLHLGNFHRNLLVAFQPIVNDYLEKLSSTMGSDLQHCFTLETWLPCKECCTAMQGCIEALESVKAFVEELHWPEELFAARLVEIVQEMCISRFVDAVKITKSHCTAAASSLNLSLSSLLPKTIVTMLNTVIYLSVQAAPFSGLASNEAVSSEAASNITMSLQTTVEELFTLVISKLTDPLFGVLDNLKKFDPTESVVSFLKKFLPVSVSASGYCKFVESNLKHLSGTMVTAGFSNFVLAWYNSQLHLIDQWLQQRPVFSLHPTQQQAITDIVKHLHTQLNDVDIPEEHLNTTSHESIGERLRMEHAHGEFQHN